MSDKLMRKAQISENTYVNTHILKVVLHVLKRIRSRLPAHLRLNAVHIRDKGTKF